MEQPKEIKRLDLGRDPIVSLLIKMSLPSIIGMLIMALYNVIDTFWIARISAEAIAALTISFPIQMIFGAIGVGTGVGVGSFASRMFGAEEHLKACRSAGQIILLALFFGILILLTGHYFYSSILNFFGATAEIFQLAEEYFLVVLFGTPFLFFMMMSNYLFRAEGNPNIPMYIIISSALINLILDPIMIFGWGPVPAMGIKGAAIATVISQIIPVFPSLYFLLSSHSKFHIRWRDLLPDFRILWAIYQVGAPSSVMHISMMLVLTVYNQILAQFGPLAIATFGLCFRINGILVMILFGIGHGVMPLVGYNFGAGNYTRLIHIVQTAVRSSALIGVGSFLLLEIFAYFIVISFTPDPELIAVAVPALRIYVTSQILMGPNIVWINMFNGIGKGLTSMTLLLLRQVFVLIPLIYFLPLFYGIDGVWLAQPVSSVISFVVIYLWTQRELKALGK